MTRLTIKQTDALIEYFQDELQPPLEVRKWLDVTTTRDNVEKILNIEEV